MGTENDQPIVQRLEARHEPSERGMSLQPTQKREVVLTLEAESVDKMRKQATVRVESPRGSTFQIICDEGPYLDGDDSAPPPLAYYSASIAFCFLTQLSRYAAVKKLNIQSMRLAQETRFSMDGSIMRGTLAGRGVEVVSRLEIESTEPTETIEQMIAVGEQSCFVLQSVINAVPSRLEATLNGQALETES